MVDSRKFRTVVFYSFYTLDDYYSKKAEMLRKNLEELDVDFYLEPIELPDGVRWPDVCRKKVGMLYEFCKKNPNRKVFWIDVDCVLDYIPDSIATFSADLIGFQRGFGNPMNIGYKNKARFWEPCFLGLNCTPAARRFIEDAYLIEQNSKQIATDDYFFEESWRLNCGNLSYQLIPSQMKYTAGKERPPLAFFGFGASGNVQEYAGKVAQHVPYGSPLSKKNQAGVGLKSTANNDTFFIKAKKIKFRVMNFLSPYVPDSVKSLRRLFVDNKKADKYPAIHSLPLKKFKLTLLSVANSADYLKFRFFEECLNNKKVSANKFNILQQAKALSYYRHKNISAIEDFDALPLCWWIHPEPGNFGDWLSPYIFSKLTKKNIKYINPLAIQRSSSCILGVGSIAKFAVKDSLVLGSGFSRSEASVNVDATYRLVRGPLTRDLIIQNGGDCPPNYGDPALIMPRLYSPAQISKSKKGKIALIRHFTHKNIVIALPKNVEEIDIFRSSPVEIENFIDEIHQFDGVISTALHGFIVSQAYGIKCALATFEGAESAVHGDGMKYEDYFLGVGMKPHKIVVLPRDMRNENLEDYLITESPAQCTVDNIEHTLRKELAAFYSV